MEGIATSSSAVSTGTAPSFDSLHPELEELIRNETVQASMINIALGWLKTNVVDPIRTSKIVQSRAFRVMIVVLGVLLLLSGIVLSFVLQAELGRNAFLFLIPAVVGLIKLLISSVCLEAPCTPEKWRLCKHLLGIAEDILDDGERNNSNIVFTG